MLSSGERLGPYTITGKVGAGGMGEVYRARDPRLERDVAVKILPERLFKNPDALKRFQREAKALAALSHPNILTVYDIGEHEGHSYVVMEILEGETLRQHMTRFPLSWEKAIEIITAVIQGLIAAHSAGIIHRDLKPENIFITRDERVKILDFGLAKKLDTGEGLPRSDLETKSQATADGMILGTVPYMSPEQARGEPLDFKSDIFTTGIILYELLTGRLPFEGPSIASIIHKILHENSPPPSAIQPAVPKWVDPVVARALAKEKENRYSTSTELLQDLKKSQEIAFTGKFSHETLIHKFRKPSIVIPLVLAIASFIFLSFWFLKRQEKIRWARNVALPQIDALTTGESWRDSTEPYKIAEQAERFIPNDPKLIDFFSKYSTNINVKTEPTGAKVYLKEYKTPKEDWTYVGISPIQNMRVPIGIYRWKLEKEGYETVEAASTTWDIDINKPSVVTAYTITRVLDQKPGVHPEMVRVLKGNTDIGELQDFYIDRYEVSNRDYKKFIDAGGYTKKEFWKEQFAQDEKVITWEEAVSKFVDQTDRPGPATWQAGEYPEGQADHPVAGVSWYEAAAYAEFVGKRLPTRAHWGLARGESTPMMIFPQLGGFAIFEPFSNFLGSSTVPVGSLGGITAYGAYDMAGNVREWCWNETPKGRLIRGGAFGDNTYMFDALSQAPPTDRSAKNGFRCALYKDENKLPEEAFANVTTYQGRDFSKEKPVSEDVFQVYKAQFSYDPTPLHPRVDSRKQNPEGWIHETITLDAAYNNERIITHLFLPANTHPPYQTVIYFPGSASFLMNSSKDLENYYEFPLFLSFLVKNGRAVLYPVYKGTFERQEVRLNEVAEGGRIERKQGKQVFMASRLFVELLADQVKDLKRCVDYLVTRKDINSKKIAYYGMSGGAWYGAIIPAVEDRLQASVLIAGGFIINPVHPEADQLNYLTRVRIPTLMLNGKYDTIFPYETNIKPMFDLLGTPKDKKQLKLYETDHIPPRNDIIKETLAWYDRYLGPVK